MGRQSNLLHRPTFSIGQIRFSKAWEERRHPRYRRLMINVFNFWLHAYRIGDYIVFKKDGYIDNSSGHCALHIQTGIDPLLFVTYLSQYPTKTPHITPFNLPSRDRPVNLPRLASVFCYAMSSRKFNRCKVSFAGTWQMAGLLIIEVVRDQIRCLQEQ